MNTAQALEFQRFSETRDASMEWAALDALVKRIQELESDLAASRSEVANQKVWMAQVERIAQLPASQDIVALGVKLANLREAAVRFTDEVAPVYMDGGWFAAAIEASR